MVDRGWLEVTIDEDGVRCLFRGWSIGSKNSCSEQSEGSEGLMAPDGTLRRPFQRRPLLLSQAGPLDFEPCQDDLAEGITMVFRFGVFCWGKYRLKWRWYSSAPQRVNLWRKYGRMQHSCWRAKHFSSGTWAPTELPLGKMLAMKKSLQACSGTMLHWRAWSAKSEIGRLPVHESDSFRVWKDAGFQFFFDSSNMIFDDYTITYNHSWPKSTAGAFLYLGFCLWRPLHRPAVGGGFFPTPLMDIRALSVRQGWSAKQAPWELGEFYWGICTAAVGHKRIGCPMRSSSVP